MTDKFVNSHSPVDPDHLMRLIPEGEAANFLGYTVRALQNWRLRGGGPRFVKISGRAIRYRRQDLIAWADDCLGHRPRIAQQTPSRNPLFVSVH